MRRGEVLLLDVRLLCLKHPKRRRYLNGYTLIEILIVLLIISIVSSVALISINHNENRQLETFANELTQLLSLAEEQAMLQPSVLGLIIDDQSLRFAAFQSHHENEKKNEWVMLQDDHLLNVQIIPKEINVSFATEHTELDHESASVTTPQIIISTNGDLTPFTIYIGRKGKKPRYVIRGEADGRITNQLLS
jgi:general secretion pathway protein H